ncbi:LysR substrate-binding domain-containing protein [Mycobacterium sp. CVI_P3]|uniref:LysR substrate-binding domain-containing protein n=1 Tax=Mycobacterium pinniadriaticum TaxID=2994102 RepID=A0ABT3SCE6_9MYCO|nr:LysR substrate-binding domain-containing protein [Mycobacterium pinniadriaticum]MCX2930764.1 LysR substrate-binding domain-containing protein [Mycobacterium pinniadriaticum]MCX2937188.1 LysR substrate-binding domain-containing protein [Mycobacterium pinniadriaticum]
MGFPAGFGLRSVIDDAFHAVGLETPVQHELTLGLPEMAELVGRGVGSAVMPRSEARHMSQLRKVDLVTPVAWQVYLASRPRGQLSRATVRLAEIIMNSPGTVPHQGVA